MARALKQLLIAILPASAYVDALLGFDRQHGAPGGHMFRPLDGVDPDIGAAIDRHYAVAVALPAQIQRSQQQIDFIGIVVGVLQELKADAVAFIAVDDHLIEPIHDKGAVIGRGDDEGERARRIGHGGRARRRTRKQGSRIIGKLGGSAIAVNASGVAPPVVTSRLTDELKILCAVP